MDRFELPATEKTPHVVLDPTTGRFEISGSSIHENADRFYAPIFDRLKDYLVRPFRTTTVQVSLVYFNSSSAKYLLDLLMLLDDHHAAGATKVVLEWCFAEDDLDMREAGQDYQGLLDMPVKLVPRRV